MKVDKPAGRIMMWLQSPELRPQFAKFAQASRLNPGWAAIVGVGVMAIYLALVPFIARTWRATGDEPHYLLAAHSLVTDLDFDLTNNYNQLDYLAFYFSRDIEPQVRLNQAGQQILNHQPGLPLLIAPAYALAGRLGVLIFQAGLGGLLAMLTFKLAVFISKDEKAALLATLLVAFSPPLFMYHYLVYPELAGALLTTLVLYLALTRSRPTPGAVGLVIVALVVLPWLNRRFVPLAILAGGLVAWAWWKSKPASQQPLPGRPGWVGLVGLMAALLSIGGLVWFNSQLEAPLRTDITVPEDTLIGWFRLGRGIGWLLDQQRGLFIFAPIYILTLWGAPLLFYKGAAADWRNGEDTGEPDSTQIFASSPGLVAGAIIGPFLLSLAVTTLAGGYWIPWELGPRFLVVALPPLAALLALAWRYYGRQKLWMGLAVLLAGISLGHSLIILRNPELPYKSSLPLFYAEKLPLPVTDLLPDLAGYTRISPERADPAGNRVVMDDGRPVWFAEAGQSLSLVQSGPLSELPFGHYQLDWPVRVEPGLPPDTELLRLSAKFLGGKPLFNKMVTAAELPEDGGYGLITYSFLNPNVDRWRTPLVFHAVSTGRSRIWGQDIDFSPNPFYAWFLPYFYLALLVGGAGLTWYRFRRQGTLQPELDFRPWFTWPRGIGWSLVLVLPLLAGGYLIFRQLQAEHTYPAANLYHLVGRPVSRAEGQDRPAWLVDPAVDPPQKAVYGPFDIYERGVYDITFRLKLPERGKAGVEVARLQVSGVASSEPLVSRSVAMDHFRQPNLYHDFVLTISNPRRQALSFEVHYLGTAALVIDQITIAKK